MAHRFRLISALLLAVQSLVSCSHTSTDKPGTNPNLARWQAQAARVTITRDTWGIPHVRGATDADAVFGVIYAQAEDDFNRVETNYINAIGRLAEAEGESEVYRDLRMKLFIDPADMKASYDSSPAWLKALMNAWADGLNYFLYTHPGVKPRVIAEFEPWMALTFSEGSIGGDIERINLSELEKFYGPNAQAQYIPGEVAPALAATASASPSDAGAAEPQNIYQEPTGSNGVAIGPGITADKHALLLINPHTSFFFRAEAQMTSDEGLNAYGAITWGQFFIYQGFNARAGWMHTSSGVDNIDEYREAVTRSASGGTYRYDGKDLPLTTKTITVPFKTATGMNRKVFTVYYTQHGPVVREADGQWISVRLMQEPLKALTQSYSRTKATTYKAFRQSMELHTNSSNNTIYADADGTIAYFHSNFIPRRNPSLDWNKPVDGTDPGTDWGPLMSIDETPLVVNPPNGWIYNSNNWPWSAAGKYSPKRADYPAYVDRGVEESPRGYHALRVLTPMKNVTMESLLAAAYDSYLPLFERHVPVLLKAYAQLPASSPLRQKLAEPIGVLRGWDYRWSKESVATSLAVYWGEEAARRLADKARAANASTDTYIAGITSRADMNTLAEALATAVDKLQADFGRWQTPWGDINRFQRLTDDIVHPFDDAQPSIPVGFTSSRWGSLASFGARSYRGSKKIYGTTGNSFVAVVEFGDRVKARAVTAGGQSGDTSSPHFNDQAERYATGNLRDVYFYPEDITAHAERTYHP